MRWTKQRYRSYLQGHHWKAFRQRYFDAFEYKCCIAGCTQKKGLELHHLSYERLGRERLEDCVYLCPEHHQAITFGSISFRKITYHYPYKKKVFKL